MRRRSAEGAIHGQARAHADRLAQEKARVESARRNREERERLIVDRVDSLTESVKKAMEIAAGQGEQSTGIEIQYGVGYAVPGKDEIEPARQVVALLREAGHQ